MGSFDDVGRSFDDPCCHPFTAKMSRRDDHHLTASPLGGLMLSRAGESAVGASSPVHSPVPSPRASPRHGPRGAVPSLALNHRKKPAAFPKSTEIVIAGSGGSSSSTTPISAETISEGVGISAGLLGLLRDQNCLNRYQVLMILTRCLHDTSCETGATPDNPVFAAFLRVKDAAMEMLESTNPDGFATMETNVKVEYMCAVEVICNCVQHFLFLAEDATKDVRERKRYC